MRILALICNVIYLGFFVMVALTDGLPKGAEMILALIAFLMPIFNIGVIGFLRATSKAVKLTALVCNIIWLGLVSWQIIDKYPSHPQEEGLIEYVVLLALTPILSAIALYLNVRPSKEAAQQSPA